MCFLADCLQQLHRAGPFRVLSQMQPKNIGCSWLTLYIFALFAKQICDQIAFYKKHREFGLGWQKDQGMQEVIHPQAQHLVAAQPQP